MLRNAVNRIKEIAKNIYKRFEGSPISFLMPMLVMFIVMSSIFCFVTRPSFQKKLKIARIKDYLETERLIQDMRLKEYRRRMPVALTVDLNPIER